MADVREKLGRLNPSTIRYDTGHGGTPDLTNIDIAAALGMVPRGLGREVLEACWWPGGANLRRNGLRDAVVPIVCTEMARQSKRLVAAHLDFQLAEAAIQWAGKPATREQQREVERARDRLSTVRKGMWPNNTMERLPLIASALVAEKAKQRVKIGGDEIQIELDAHRSAVIGVDQSDYPRRWKAVYEWLRVRMDEAEEQAAKDLEAALRRLTG